MEAFSTSVFSEMTALQAGSGIRLKK